MNKADWNYAHMLAGLLYRVGTGRNDAFDVDRITAIYERLNRTGRTDIIAEAERICNKRKNERGE